MKLVGVGSTNPVKIQAVVNAIGKRIGEVRVVGREVASLVSSQPMSDDETQRGARERARGALHFLKADIGVGLEGGVFIENGRVWNTVWCCVIDAKGGEILVNGSRFILPEKLSREILKGKEMGDAMDALTGISEVHKKMGMLGVVTEGWVDRRSEYCHLVELAMGRLLSDWR